MFPRTPSRVSTLSSDAQFLFRLYLDRDIDSTPPTPNSLDDPFFIYYNFVSYPTEDLRLHFLATEKNNIKQSISNQRPRHDLQRIGSNKNQLKIEDTIGFHNKHTLPIRVHTFLGFKIFLHLFNPNTFKLLHNK